MLKREIKYEDFDGNPQTEVFYFNISRTELMEMEAKGNGMQARIQRIVEANDREGLIKEFKGMILLAYGQKSEDGKRFIKSPELTDEFTQTAAYEALFTELSSQDGAAVDFFRGIIPKEMVTEFDKASLTSAAASSAPTPPQPPAIPSQ